MRGREFLAGSAAAAAPAADRRNAILVYCEQLQHNVGSFAGGPARTPNLEKFAARAVTFRTACTTTGLCSPNRAALFPGRLGHRTGLDDNCNVWHSRLTRLDPSQTTLIVWARRRDRFIGYFAGMDEFYDLKADPAEPNNLAAGHAAVAGALAGSPGPHQ